MSLFANYPKSTQLNRRRTGATGYIGGDVLFELAGVHSNYQITCLVRSKEGAQSIKKSFPNVRTVVGSLDSTDLVTAEAANADVILSEIILKGFSWGRCS